MRKLLVVDRKRGCRCDPVRSRRGWTMQRTCFESDMGGRDRTHEVQCEHGSTARNASSADLTAAFVEQCKQDGRAERVSATIKAERRPYASLGSFADNVIEALDLSALLEKPEAISDEETDRATGAGREI